ncbi:ceramidase domain-containing protein [Chlorobaculum sp. 24CR]|uniref:ceramidase domain-containing protein n=1 Tax=Chlorobaculum sp. 24CR TaxID=2508878 RepID=UPI001FD6C265|nr:ceramidase domain-containing protein [Chlorobaculum sp. 24CR]
MLYEYCERSGAGLFDEPINLLTNLSFIVAAWFVFRLMKERDAFGSGNVTLLALMVSIGLGSALYHSFAARWAAACDVFPIFAYQITFLWLYMTRVVRLGGLRSVLLTTGFLLVSLYALSFKGALNGSVLYLPAISSVMIVAVYHYFSKKAEPMMGIYALIVFAVSLFFRTIDATLCPVWSYGTHFLWHLFNGVLLYLTSRIIIVNSGLKEARVERS